MNDPIVFFGNERLATGVSTTAPTLRGLLEAGFNVVAVVSHNENTSSRTRRTLEIAAVAEQFNVPLLLPSKPSEITEQLKAFKPRVGVLVAYGKIVPQSVIDIFPAGIVNIHPSLLPLHRGPIPLESVILDDSKRTGVSLMNLSKEMDAGSVYAYSEVNLNGHETKQKLADELIELGSSMLLTLLPRIVSGDVTGKPQDDTGATYDALITKEDGILDWSKPAERLEREVRAYQGWPQSRTLFGGHAVIITAAHVIPSTPPEAKPGDVEVIKEAKSLAVATSNGSLRIDRLKPAGKTEMPTAAFLNGYGKDL